MAGYIGNKAVNLSTSGADISGTTNLDAVDIDGAVQIDATLSVGVNDTGYDVKFFGATASRHMTWDESADSLIISGNLDVNDGTIKLDGAYPIGTANTALGDAALDSLTSGGSNVAIGNGTLTANTSGNNNVGMGRRALISNTSGGANVAIGLDALYSNTTASNNTAVGYQAAYTNTTSGDIVAVGALALYSNTGANNTAVGLRALQDNTTSEHNSALGKLALRFNTTGANNTAVGSSALQSNTTASSNTAVGYQAGYTNVAAGAQVFVGYKAGYATTNGGGSSTFVGYEAGLSNTTGGNNTALGRGSFLDNTTGTNNVGLGYDALANNTTASSNTAVGYQALYLNTTGAENVAFGAYALDSVTTGSGNAAIGYGSGNTITTGSKNTILGAYDGNQGGLDIRTSSNIIVLSDGDGNPRMHFDASGNLYVATTNGNPTGNHVPGTLISALGQINVHRDGGNPLRVGNSVDGNLTEYYKQGALVGSIGFVSTGAYIQGETDHSGFRLGGSQIVPFRNGADTDNTTDLGASGTRFDDIFATNGTIQTSDRNEKQDIKALSDAEQRVAVACRGLLRKFRWKDAVAEKGEDARIHFGIIAQDLQDAFAAEGLDAGRYAMFISSTWWETQTDVPAVEAVAEVLDEDGNVVTEAVEAKEAYTRTDTYETLEEAPEGATERTRLGVRYPELLAFIIASI